MRGDVYVSGGGRLRRLAMHSGETLRETPIEGCGAVCARAGTIYAASDSDGVVYRLDEQLLPCGVFSSGPGLREMCVSADEKRLYLLLADADSVLMLDARDGTPQLLARVGANPCRLRLNADAQTLIVAGGREGSASVLCASTLNPLCTYREEGVCCDALQAGGMTCMLLLTPSLDARLVVWDSGQRWQLGFPGLPGSLCRRGRMLLLCAGEWLYDIDPARRRACRKRRLPCAAGQMTPMQTGILLLSPLDESLHWIGGENGSRRLCAGVQHAAAE